MWSKDQQFHYFFPLDIYENMFYSFCLFFRLLFSKGTRFKFYLTAVLVCYLYFTIYPRAHNVFKQYCGVFSGHVYCGWPWTWQEMRSELCQNHCALWDDMLVCFQLSRSLVLLIFNIFTPLFLTCTKKFEVDWCQSNLYVMLNQLFFHKFYDFFCRWYSLINWPCYNNLLQFM